MVTDSPGTQGADLATPLGLGDAGQGKRERLVGAARELVYLHGIAGTSLADIAQAADVPVGNVYYYFKTKDDLIGAVVRSYEDRLRSALAELERRHRSPRARLKGLVGVLADWAAGAAAHYGAQFGCPYGTLSSELAKRVASPDRLAATLMQIQTDWAEQQFRAIGRRDARDLAIELMATYEGSALLTSTLGQPEILARQARRLQRWIETVPGRASDPGP